MNYKLTLKSEVPSFGWPKSFNLGRLISLTAIAVLALALANLIGTNALATQGVVLDQILSETDRLGKENQRLTIEISKKANLSYIQTTAANLGFVKVRSNLIISADEALAAAR